MKKKKRKLSSLFILFVLNLLFGVLSPWLSTPLAAKYPPTMDWREIANEIFIVVFPRGYETDAVYTLETATRLHGELIDLWGQGVREKTRILLTDVYDEGNGSAIFYPYNTIEIYLFNPSPDSDLGSGRDWIRSVLSHEMTHIITANYGSGLTYFLRGILGNNPAFYPVVYMPDWLVEGMAVYAESQLVEGGRLNIPDYRQMLKQIAGAGNMPDWTGIWGEHSSWPGATTPYLYGGAFIDFLARTYGKDKIRQFLKSFTHYPIPLTVKRSRGPIILTTDQQFRLVFDKGISGLWQEFIEDTVNRTRGEGQLKNIQGLEILTDNGKYHSYPVEGDKGIVYYVYRNYQDYPGIFCLEQSARKQKRLASRYGVNSLTYSRENRALYFSAPGYYKTFYYYSDLYRLDTVSGKIKRLSKGARLSYPVPDPLDRERLFCSQRHGCQSYLAALDMKTRKCRTLSHGFDALAFISHSPANRSIANDGVGRNPENQRDHGLIAASLKRKEREWAIGLFDGNGTLLEILTDEKNKCYQPVWKSAEELFFICRQGDTYGLASVDLKTKQYWFYTAPGFPAVRTFSLAETGNKVIFSFFDANGLNLGSIGIQNLEKTSLAMTPSAVSTVMAGGNGYNDGDNDENRPIGQGMDKCRDKGPGAGKGDKEPGVKGVKGYRFLRELLPQYINLTYRTGGNEFQPGLMLQGNDLPVRHYYILEAFYGFSTQTLNYAFSYTYDGLYPSLTLSYSDLSDDHLSSLYGHYIHNEREWVLSALFPVVNRQRFQLFLYTDIHFEEEIDNYTDIPATLRLTLNGIKAGVFYNSAQRYYDSISPADGFKAGVSYAREVSFLGSDYEINTMTLEYKHYLGLSRPNVLAFRLVAVNSWGEAGRVFSMGGSESYTGFSLAGHSVFELMRGYPSGYFAGTGGYLFNLEYRLLLWNIERALLINSSIERIDLTFFTDIGQVWLNDKWKTWEPSISLGAELSVTVYVGDFLFTLTGGAAVGQNPSHTAVFYFRLGRSF